jgi:1-deoxy-D-xylulose-5-phosphate reductoisomerase
VTAFLAGRLAFPAILDTVSAVLGEHDVGSESDTLTVPDVLSAESWARSRARQISEARADEETTQQ